MKESEKNQECCGLDMPNGLHDIDYPQRFVKAPKSLHPVKSSNHGKECEPDKIMSQTMHAR
jgi:hypothetical protein